MALSFIGKPISLISHSDVRYRGILAGIDPQASTIQLSNVYSMGTEQRRPPNQFIAPVQDPYAYIIFRASEVKDLSVDEPPAGQQHNVHDDPAVLGAGGPAPKPYVPYPTQANGPPPAQGPPPSYATTAHGGPASTAPPAPQQIPQPAAVQPPPVVPNRAGPPPNTNNNNNNNRRPNPVHTAAASLETVERALGDLRVSSVTTNTRGGRRGQGGHRGGRGGEVELKVPTTDFDFQSSNAKFDKTTVGSKANVAEDGNNPGEPEAQEKVTEKAETAYNPQKSFFDSLSSSSGAPTSGSGGGGPSQGNRRGRGSAGGAGRNRREEEREKNVATFGEPGGVGLLGPGSYVGGWGGYGRRGGRPRRGGGGGGRGGGNNGGNHGPPAVQA